MSRLLTALVVIGLLAILGWSIGRGVGSTPDAEQAAAGALSAPAPTEPTATRTDPAPAVASLTPGRKAIALPDLTTLYDPVEAGEPLPAGFRQLIPRDGIRPVYAPEYVPAASIDWPDGTLVVGVAVDGEARAYPVSFLNRREMVIDRIAGIPVLVTW